MYCTLLSSSKGWMSCGRTIILKALVLIVARGAEGVVSFRRFDSRDSIYLQL